jgi:hypothetical protein
MSTHSIPELLQLWPKGELTVEQAVGHLLQNLLTLFQWHTEVERRLCQLGQPLVKPQR